MNEMKQRHGCISAWLWIAIIVNLATCLVYVNDVFALQSTTKIMGSGLLAVFALINILGCILLMRWNKTGFYVFVISSVLASIVNIALMEIEAAFFLSSLFSILIWWGVLQIKKDGISAWKLMDGGWDYLHCRHLYQLFCGLSIVLIVLTAFSSLSNGSGQSVADNDIKNQVKNDEDVVKKEVVADKSAWKTFEDKGHSCSVKAPNDFRYGQLSDDQILGVLCSDYDPAIVVIRESVKDLSAMSIISTKDYANLIVKNNQNVEGVTGFSKISGENYSDNGYLVVYDLNVDGTLFRYNVLTKKTKNYFYYCMVFCLQEYADKLQPTVTHMLTSFKVMK